MVTLAAFPAPPGNHIWVFNAYGLMLALGVGVAWFLAERRWRGRGHDPADIAAIAVPIIIAGVIGARVYHLFTGYDWEANGLAGTLALWNGGLSIWGAVIGGGIAAVIVARRRRLPVLELLDTLAPAVVVAQAIGRWGNWFNQELFGRPTDLPWGLEVDPAVAVRAGYEPGTLFHPTFLYESLWCLGIFAVLTAAERAYGARWHRGQTVAGYVALYTLGRTFFEFLRIDKAQTALGTSFNLWLSIVLCVGATVAFVLAARNGAPYPGRPGPLFGPAPAAPVATAGDESADDEATEAAEPDDSDIVEREGSRETDH